MKTAMVFPGQGSQSVGMLNAVAALPVVKHTLAEAADCLGYDLALIIGDGPAERLNRTIYTQPAMLAADVALWRLWRERQNAVPDFVAGHSLGEYAALVAAEAIAFDDAMRVVAERAKLMQAAVVEGAGAMAAIILLPVERVREICRAAAQDQVVTVANINEANQIVIAGHAEAVDRAVAAAKTAGAKLAKLLPVSVPSHCPLMEPAAVRLAACLAQIDIHAPKIPVVNNVAVQTPSQPQAIRQALTEQIYKPVRWSEIIEYLAAQGVAEMIECGPGKVLTGLTKRICKNIAASVFTGQTA